MKKSDDELTDFFASMRKTDSSIEVPNFDDVVKKQLPKKNYFLPLGIAASLLIIISTYLLLQQPVEQPKTMELIISLGNQEESTTQQLITQESTIDGWESPTRALIADF